MAMTVSAMAMPGKNAHHQLPRLSALWALDSALPQLTWVSEMPKLRKRHERLEHDVGGHQQGHRTR